MWQLSTTINFNGLITSSRVPREWILTGTGSELPRVAAGSAVRCLPQV